MPPEFLGVARQVLAEEALENASSLELVDALVSVYGKLGGRLTPVIGHEGYNSLFGRALHLANLEFPFLRPVGIGLLSTAFSPDSEVFIRLREGLRDHDPAGTYAGLEVAIGSFAWLLSIFIGDDLAHRELLRVWPSLSFEDASSGSEESRK